MKTTFKKSDYVKKMLLTTFGLFSFYANAAPSINILKNITDSFSGAGIIGVYIIFGILAFGLIGFWVSSRILKKQNENQPISKNDIRHSSYHKHQHRIVKKTA